MRRLMPSVTGMISKSGEPAAVAGVAAVRAADGDADRRAVEERVVGAERAAEMSTSGFSTGSAHAVAELAGEPLRGDERERRGDEVRLDAHVDEPHRRGRGALVVCSVESTRCPVMRRIGRDARGLGVADLTDEARRRGRRAGSNAARSGTSRRPGD